MEMNSDIINYVPSSHHFDPLTLSSSSSVVAGENSSFQTQQNPRKKRSKFLRMDPHAPKPRKPDPTAPKITRPCTECGKKFWSWKALFGHMRCHPERQWRGINPPPNFLRRSETTTTCSDGDDDSSAVKGEDHEVATCLLMLANGPTVSDHESPSITTARTAEYSDPSRVNADDQNVQVEGTSNNNRFECSSCKKVFGSHQALGGHRASHKNVKGCYATSTKSSSDQREEWCFGDPDKCVMDLGHRCSICLRVFSSGQALGGHKRCHWEKVGFDLNVPVLEEEEEEDGTSSSSSHACFSHEHLGLDLRLGL